MELQHGDRVEIVGGIFKKKKYGTYLRPYGDKGKMVCVRIDNDDRRERQIWASSIRPITKSTRKKAATPKAAPPPPRDDSISISRADYNSILEEIAGLIESVKALELKVKGLEN